MRVVVVVVKAPLTSSIRTLSSPPRVSTSMAPNVLRSNVRSAEPSSPTSTWSWVRSSGLFRSTMWSANGPPVICRVPSITEALTDGAAAAGLAAPARTPRARALAPMDAGSLRLAFQRIVVRVIPISCPPSASASAEVGRDR